MDFSSAVIACLREVELSSISPDAIPQELVPAGAVDSNVDASMLMADGVAIGYASKRKKKAKRAIDSNLSLQVHESDPSIRLSSISQPASQPAFLSQPDEEEDSTLNAWHFHAIVIAERPSEPGPMTTAADEHPTPPPSASVVSPSATLIVLRDMQPVFDLGTLLNPSPIIKGIKRVPFDSFGFRLKSLDPGEEGKGSITLSHWTDAPGAKKKLAANQPKNRYELKTVVIHAFSGQHALSLVDPSSEAPPLIKPLNPTSETNLVTEALNKALVDLRFQALSSEEVGGPSFGISKHEEKLNEAIPAINRSILSILSAATNVHLLPFALNLFKCNDNEELGDTLFLSTCETVSQGILSKSKRGGRKDRSKKAGEPAGEGLGLLCNPQCAVVEMSQEQFFTQGRGVEQEEYVEEEEGQFPDGQGGIRGDRGRQVMSTIDPLLERRHAAYGGIKPKEVQVIDSECDWF
jgi:hypothetical protein